MNIENGRVIDRTETGVMLKSALRAIVDKYHLTMVCTPNQSVLFKDIAPEQREGVEAILSSYGVKPIEQVWVGWPLFFVLSCFGELQSCCKRKTEC